MKASYKHLFLIAVLFFFSGLGSLLTPTDVAAGSTADNGASIQSYPSVKDWWPKGGKVGPVCDKGRFSYCNRKNGTSCSSDGAFEQCRVNHYYCEPGVCYCNNSQWRCF